ncbi:hypothetical protein PISL3812_09245 [Talaromyces islandicus]|uniref:G-patch domain-containing protein n=1 Tax=Talaromyces islandicus TaxID=28573 RepID=A0A0U1M9F3_TALIS|nr:hypothetical protein PISL3812_09245 [Talaromyces islandicus]
MSADDEDDYMSMVIEEPRAKETFSQRKLRLQRESEARARVPSKAERAAAEEARREHALASSVLDPANKGYKMMLKLGFSPGDSLGKKQADPTKPESHEGRVTPTTTTATTTTTDGGEGSSASDWVQSRAEPLRLVVKEDRGGIGLDSEKKRKFRADVAGVSKKSKAEEGEYRERMRLEREERRIEGQVHAAQKVAEKLDADLLSSTQSEKTSTARTNVLYRGLVREREERERDRLVRQALETSLPSSFFPKPRLPGSSKEEDENDEDHPDDEKDDSRQHSFFEQDQDTEDPELDEFNALAAGERLQKLVLYLREKHWYCFWCKSRYEDSTLEGCPGITEEDHD